MRNLLLALLLVAGVSAAQAQTYQPAVARGTVLGAIAGAFVGGHNNDRWAQGAVIGAAAGAIIGAVIDDSRQQPCGQPSRVVYTQSGCAPQVGYGQAPQVVYVTTPPQVIYVQARPQRVVYTRPAVYVAVDGGHRRHHHQPRW